MTWPPESPDLNPIELLCDKLHSWIRTKSPTSERHLGQDDPGGTKLLLPFSLDKLIEKIVFFSREGCFQNKLGGFKLTVGSVQKFTKPS